MGILYLKTFGGLSVAVDGAPGSGAAQQRKTLALLALLAPAGRNGISRDRLVAYLWPDADAEHARGLLKQACYALRRDLHQPDLFIGTTELRLNPAIIASDLQDFEAALERRDAAQAAVLYAGPFLDGFYLNDSAEFERWVEAERNRLRQRARAALETLATDAGGRGDHRTAVEWWRRLAALDRLNSRVALGLMNALASTGDRAGALQVARVHASLLREELDAAPDAAVLELTERLRAETEAAPVSHHRAVPVAAALEDVAAAGERSGEPAPPDQPVDAARRPQAHRRRAPLVLALAAGGLLVGGWLLLGAPFGGSAATATEPKRLVVLPFTNLGPADDEYFADGITEEIAARLAAIGGLRVIGSTSANVYRGTKKTIQEIGRELGVDYVLEGSVRWQKPGQGQVRVRVTPQLVSTADGTHLWAEVYDEPLDEIFRVQSDIAQKVVQALDITLLERQRRVVEAAPTRNLQAYDYYLRGDDYRRRGSADVRALQASQQMYERAVELDPTFAEAYAKLSIGHSHMYLFYYDRSPERLAMAKRAVDRALQLEPSLPEGHSALAEYYGFGQLDYDRALREFATVEASRPNQTLLGRAVLRVRQGRFPEALADHDRAWQLDPRSSSVANQYAQVYDLLRKFNQAEALYDRALVLAPDRAVLYFWKAWLYLRWDGTTQRARVVLDEGQTAGVADDQQVRFTRVLVELFDRRYEEAIGVLASETPVVIQGQARFVPRAQLFAQVYGLMGRPLLERAYYDSARSFVVRRVEERPEDARLHGALGIAYAGLGRKQEAIQEGERGVELLPISKEAYQGYYRVLDLARIYVMVGEHDAAIDRLEHLLSIPGHLTRAWLRVDPTWDPLRGHPRFQRLVGREQ